MHNHSMREQALSATEGEAEPVAWLRFTHSGFGCELSRHIAYALPEGLHAVYASPPSAPAGVKEQAIAHAIDLEQCSLFVDSAPLKKSMTDAAAFLRSSLQPDTQAAAASAPAGAEALPGSVELTDAMIEAGRRYIDGVAFLGEHNLPAQFRWHELWDVMMAAALSSAPAQEGRADG